MKQRAVWLCLAVCVSCMSGCVERRFVITTSPPGAIVYDERHLPTGAAPTDREFTYYGKYRFTLVHDGFQTKVVEENVKPPWYEWIGLDFISENLIPWTIKDVRRFHYVLEPAQIVPEQAILEKAGLLRQKGQEIGEPLPVPFPEPGPPPGTLPQPVPIPQPGSGPTTPPRAMPGPPPGSGPTPPPPPVPVPQVGTGPAAPLPPIPVPQTGTAPMAPIPAPQPGTGTGTLRTAP
ncbi:MAG TPA: hypothetical protein VKE98_00360 [Gemmataceae bacterium]|nr:hypothetical protein [Gemmataceae bacterium]